MKMTRSFQRHAPVSQWVEIIWNRRVHFIEKISFLWAPEWASSAKRSARAKWAVRSEENEWAVRANTCRFHMLSTQWAYDPWAPERVVKRPTNRRSKRSRAREQIEQYGANDFQSHSKPKWAGVIVAELLSFSLRSSIVSAYEARTETCAKYQIEKYRCFELSQCSGNCWVWFFFFQLFFPSARMGNAISLRVSNGLFNLVIIKKISFGIFKWSWFSRSKVKISLSKFSCYLVLSKSFENPFYARINIT